MKGYCFLILAVAFLMYFQKEPIFTITILGIGIGFYLFIKAKKSGRGLFNFMGGNENQHNSQMNDLITLIILQQFFNDNKADQPPERRQSALKEERINQTDMTEREIMALFEQHRKSTKNNINS